MNQAKDCGPRFLISARMHSRSSVCNRKTSNVQPAFARLRRGARRTPNTQIQHSEIEIRSWALSVRRLLPKLLPLQRCEKSLYQQVSDRAVALSAPAHL